jgi:flagellar hook assembly protein FlgD
MVTIEIYSVHGSLVAVPYRQMLSTGQHTILWEGNGLRNEKLSPGIYLYRISVGDNISDGKISIAR